MAIPGERRLRRKWLRNTALGLVGFSVPIGASWLAARENPDPPGVIRLEIRDDQPPAGGAGPGPGPLPELSVRPAPSRNTPPALLDLAEIPEGAPPRIAELPADTPLVPIGGEPETRRDSEPVPAPDDDRLPPAADEPAQPPVPVPMPEPEREPEPKPEPVSEPVPADEAAKPESASGEGDEAGAPADEEAEAEAEPEAEADEDQPELVPDEATAPSAQHQHPATPGKTSPAKSAKSPAGQPSWNEPVWVTPREGEGDERPSVQNEHAREHGERNEQPSVQSEHGDQPGVQGEHAGEHGPRAAAQSESAPRSDALGLVPMLAPKGKSLFGFGRGRGHDPNHARQHGAATSPRGQSPDHHAHDHDHDHAHGSPQALGTLSGATPQTDVVPALPLENARGGLGLGHGHGHLGQSGFLHDVARGFGNAFTWEKHCLDFGGYSLLSYCPPVHPQHGPLTLGEDYALHGRGRFESDHGFDGFIAPVSNPYLAKDPRATTAVRGMFVSNWIPGRAPVLGGGDFQTYTARLSLALTERLQVSIDRVGLADFHDANGNGGSGWQNLIFGGQYTFLRDPARGLLVSGGLQVDTPVGASSVFQGHGANLAVYGTFGKQLAENWHLLGTVGQNFALEDATSGFFFTSLHLDYQFGWLYPLIEMNYYHYNQSGTRLNGARIDADGLFSMGGNVARTDLLTLAVGGRIRLAPRAWLGAAYEFPVSDGRGLVDGRVTADLIFQY